MTGPNHGAACVRCQSPARIVRRRPGADDRHYCSGCFLALGDINPGESCSFVEYPTRPPGASLAWGTWTGRPYNHAGPASLIPQPRLQGLA